MPRSLHLALGFSFAVFLGGFLGAATGTAQAASDLDLRTLSPGTLSPGGTDAEAVKQPPPDPNRKRAGEPCKSSDECQRHHSCEKVGDQTRCQAPPSKLPPGAVT